MHKYNKSTTELGDKSKRNYLMLSCHMGELEWPKLGPMRSKIKVAETLKKNKCPEEVEELHRDKKSAKKKFLLSIASGSYLRFSFCTFEYPE
jgi:hypothetical protein